jgi:ubiquinone/menaquinone biosynthesis C-methylase UbiE
MGNLAHDWLFSLQYTFLCGVLNAADEIQDTTDRMEEDVMQKQKLSTEMYSLGHAPKEIQRLLMQGQLLNGFTRRVLADAGITVGMKVLDVGCGPGDVSLIAAELVGETGSVLGVDANASVLEVAESRAQAAGLTRVSFLVGDIRQLPLDQDFDAIVGRLILEHVPDYLAILRRLLQHLRPGGVVAFQEYDMVGVSESSLPHSLLWEQACTWCIQTFQRVGVETRMGMKLSSTFLEAGLPAPQMSYEAAIGTGPAWLGYEWIADAVRSLLPLMVKFGIATEEEVGIETLANRIREESSQRSAAHMPPLVSAWTRKG